MVHMADSQRAASLAREHALPIGLHLNLVEPFDEPSTPAAVRDRQARLVRRLRRRRLRYWVYDPLLRADVEACIADQLGALYSTEPTTWTATSTRTCSPTAARAHAAGGGRSCAPAPSPAVDAAPRSREGREGA